MVCTNLYHRTQVLRRAVAPVAGSVLLLSIATAPLTVGGTYALAGPSNGSVKSGVVQWQTNGDLFLIRQLTKRAIVNWEQFNSSRNQEIRFAQPSADSAILNRVTGPLPSRFDGKLTSNGSVYLINPHGVVVGPSGQINVGGSFVASTLDVDDDAFLNAGNLDFSGSSDESIVNLGSITGEHGSVFLIARNVTNEGSIQAQNGTTGLAAGSSIELRLGSSGEQLAVRIGTGTVTNTGSITSASAELHAAAGNMYALAINNGGVIRASTVTREGGRILLRGGSGVTLNTGTLDASAGQNAPAKATGGAITVTGENVMLGSTSRTLAVGPASGGIVRIGTDKHAWDTRKSDPNHTPFLPTILPDKINGVATSDAVVMAPGATIDVSSSLKGSGGTAVLWSQKYTDFEGTIFANAGPRGGGGGWIETSSRENLQALGLAFSHSNDRNRRGGWLLDPQNVTISTSTTNGSFSGGNPNVFTPTGTATVLNTTIETSLNAGTDVTITTGSTGASNGDISVTSSISKTSGASATLWLAAANNITLTNVSITSTSNALNIVLQSDSDGSNVGKISFSGTDTITTNNGTLTMSGGNYTLANLQSTGYASNTTGGTAGVNLGSATTISTGTGNVYIRGKGIGTGANYYDGIDMNGGSITTTTGNITLDGVGGSGSSSSNDGLYLAGGSITSAGGAISLTGLASSTATTSNNFRGVLIANTIANSSTGTISITGTGGTAAAGTGNYGINLANSGKIQSNGSGAITLTAYPGGGSTAFYASGTGTRYIGLGALAGSYTGTLTISADTVTFGTNTNITGSGALIIQPTTASTTIGLGTGATGTLNLDSTELGYFTDGFSSITIGLSTGTGAVDVRAWTANDPITIQSGGSAGSITINGALATGSGSSAGSITLKAGNGVTLGANSITTQGQAITITTDNDSNSAGDLDTSASSSIAANGGDITITTATMTLGGGTISSTGNLIIQPAVAATTIGLGNSAVGTLNLDVTELGYLSDGFASITIGSTSASGAVVDVRTVAFTDPVTIRTTSRIDLNGALSTGSGSSIGSIWLRAGNAVNFAASATVTTQGQDIVLNGDWDASGNGGVIMASGSSATSNGGNIIVGGGSSPSTTVTYGTSGLADSAFQMTNATLSSGAGNITVNAQGRAGSAGSRGLYMLSGSQISSTSGNITITATGGAATSTNQGVYITGSNTKITTASGAISITGTGAGTSSNNPGIQVDSSGAITATTTGTITLVGTGAATAAGTDSHYGVHINTGTISVVDGAMSITGTAGGPTGATQYGVYMQAGTITSTGLGSITISGSNTNGSQGFYMAAGSITATSSGAISVTGSSTTGSGGHGIELAGGAIYTSSGTLSLTGTSGAATPIKTSNSPAIGNASQSGALTLSGNDFVISSTTTISGTGALTIQPTTTSTTMGIGTSASATMVVDGTELDTIQNGFSSITIGRTDSSGAVDVRSYTFKDNVTIRTPASAGSITINGALATGSGTSSGTITLQAGANITVANLASITSQGSAIVLNSDRDANSAGYISLSGAITSNGGDIILSGGAGANNAALIASGAAYSATAGTPSISITNGITVSSGAGNIYINGTGGTGGASAIHGVNIDTSAVVSSTTGSINIIGIATTTGSASTQYGVYLNAGSITSTSGNISITGTASTGATGTDQGGIRLTGSGSKIQTGGTGTITIVGTGGAAGTGANNTGIRLGSGTAVQSNGSGDITITVYAGAGSPAFYTSTATNYVGLGQLSGSYTGNITINADSILLTGANIAGSGTLTIQPTTASTTIGLGASATGTLNLDATELGYLQNGFSSITIGSASGTGAVDVRAWTATDPLTIRTPGAAGSITINGSLATGSTTSAGSITLSAGNGVTLGANSITTQNQAININTDADGNGTGDLSTSASSSIAANGGAITITSGTMTLGGGTISSTGALVLQPSTAAATIGLGASSTGTFNLTATEVGYFSNGFSSITVGRSDGTGAIDVRALTWNDDLTLTGSSSTVTFNGAQTLGSNTLTINTGGATTQSAAISAASLQLIGGGSVTLANTSNVITTLAANTGAISYYNNGSLTVGTVGATTGITSTGTVLLQTASSSDITLSQAITSSAAGNSVVLASGRNFINSAGASAITASSGRWLVYSVRPDQDTNTTLTATHQYNKTYAGNPPATISASNTSYFVHSYAPTVTLTADNQTKTYGTATPTLTYTVNGLFNGDSAGNAFSGTPSLAVSGGGTNAGTYTITTSAGTVSALNGYTIAYANGTLTVNPASLSVTAAAKSKTYGGSDPSLTYTYSGLVNSDTSSVFTGALARTAGENVGTYAINQGTLSAGSNYTISYTGANLTINAASLTVTAAAKSKTYGAADPTLTYTYSGLVNSDTASVFSGSLARTAGENVGTYAINQGTVSAGSNYTISYVSNNLTINPATLTITAVAKSKAYGASDPTLTYTYSGLTNSDTASVITGALSRTAGENVGTYAINQGSVTASSNYTISYVSDNLTISAATLNVTAVAKSKTYGASDPSLTYTYSGLQGSDTASVFTGALSRTAGENVGTYAINQGTLSAGSNYSINYTSANLTINPAALTVTAAAKSKTYGAADPSLTYTYSGLTNSDTSSVFTGALSRTTGENVGTYAINQGTLSAGSNYTISYVSDNLTINPATLTITATAKSKTYGASDPALTYTYSGLTNSDTASVITGSLSRTTGENVGTYAINQGSVTASSNYTISYVSNNLTISAATLTVTADVKSKTYGAADPSLTYTYSGLQGSDTSSVFTGALSRTTGENVGTYAINQNTLSAGSNYTISYTGANLTINPATLTVTAAAKSKTYGAADPSLTYTYSGLTNSDTASVFTGALSRTTGENVGTYAINQGTLSAGSNYTISYVSDNLTINPATLSVTAATKSKTYGAADPSLTYSYSGLQGSDTASVFTGALSRTAGENVGTYAINQGTLSAGSNYTISYTGANLTINAATLTITADGKSKTYGAADPTLTYTYSGLTNSDTASVITGSLARIAGENVGTYAINQGTVSAGSNYTINYVGSNLTISAAVLNVNAVAKSKTYGAADPSLTYTYSGLQGSDTASVFTGSLTRATGENVGTYGITQGTLSAGSNYSINYTSDYLTINPAALTVTAVAKSKTYGASDPALTYTYSGLTNSDTSAVFSGSLARTAGENVGTYAINQGTVTAGSNYTITYVSDNLTINPATLTITAAAKSKTYGAADPALTYTYSGLTGGDTASVITGSLARTAGENVGTYAINQGTVAAGSNYSITYVGNNLTINPATLTITADAKSKTYGATDPALTYTYSGLTGGDTASVITGSLARTSGENVGTYAINQGSVTAGSNYSISYVSSNLTINQATLTITADAKSKTYGAADPALTYTYSGLVNSDTSAVLSGSLARTTGENVGSYAINQGSVTAGVNYAITYVADNLTINPAALTVTAAAKSKTYGGADPTLTYTYSGLTNSDTAAVFSGSLARTAGENVGTYAINQGTVTAGSNYTITYVGDNLTINPATLTITAAAKSKTYGNTDPALTYTYSGLTNSDTATVITGSLARTAGENVGTYAINLGTVSAGSNYTISYVGNNLTINAATLTITADAKSKTYGASDPALTYTYSGLANGDTASVITGSLSRTAGENAGVYAINQGSVTASSNYTISYVSDNLTINPAALTITADPKSKTYGATDPSLTYTYSGLTHGDTSAVFTGSLSRTSGENVGTYAINQGTLTAGSNYSISYVSDDLTINPATLTITADAKSKTYGAADPTLTYTYSGLTHGDTSSVLSGSLARAAGENVGTYAINQGSVSAGANYTINYVSDNLTINPATLTITADTKGKTYGDLDPTLTYTYSGLTHGDTAAVITGALDRDPGEDVGTYAIVQGTVDAGSNYTITYVSNNLTISKAALTIVADSQHKTYGQIDPDLTYAVTGLTNGDKEDIVTGSLARASGENVGTYAINQGTVAATANYTITYVGDNLTISPAALTITAAAKSKTYGASDPALTYTYSGLTNGDTSAVFGGSLARTAGENVGTYTINQGTLTPGTNYTVTYVGSNLTINPATLTITADAKTKTYGNADPTLTYTYTGLTNGDTASVITGSLARNTGENVGTYAINQGTVSASSNYTVTYIGDNLTINPAMLTITADAKSKTYGDTDPALTYTYAGLANGDTSSVITGSLTRVAGENVGVYAINQGSVAATNNYTISYVGNNLSINTATLTITADAKSKTYGDVDPTLTYTYSGLTHGDTAAVITGSLVRTAGENVGACAINQGSVSAGSNYSITYVGDNLTINPATLTITADAKSKTYGNVDPSLTYTYSGLTHGDTAAVITGSLTRNSGENVGTYAINQGSVSAGGNYTISYVGDNLTINPATLTITADAKSKTYGTSDPTLTYTYAGLANGDTASVLTGSLARTAGENVGTYAINQGSVSAGSNYTISYIGNNLTINPATLTITADAQGKIYGDADPTLTYTHSGLANGDTAAVITGALDRDPGENVGAYAITQGTIDAGSNYTINYVGNNLTISKAALLIVADPQHKTYGQIDPDFTYAIDGLTNGDKEDTVTGSLVRATGENVGTYAINQGSLTAGGNYTITYVGDNLTITPASLTVTAAAKSKTYGAVDPALTYTYSGLTNGDTGSVFTGSLARTAGENVGTYAINQGSVSAGANYTITYVGNNLTINPASLMVTADAKTKTYGATDPTLTYSYSGLTNGDTSAVFSGSLVRNAGENVGAYTINQGSVSAGSNYTITYVADNLTINPASLTITANPQSKTYGTIDPSLTYAVSGLANGDTTSVVTGALTRNAGENVGTYAINQGSIAAGSNYTITYVGDNLTINPATLTITADAKTKTYGASDPSLTYTISGLANGDTSSVVTGSLTRNAGENVGSYAINRGSVAASSNYTISYVSDNLTINPATLTITAAPKSKTYGSFDPALTYSISGLQNGDSSTIVTGALTRTAGENAGTYPILQGSVAAGSNYTINYVGDNLTITAAILNVLADQKSKTYGDADPSLTFSVSGLHNGDTIATVFTGGLDRDAGESVGIYSIHQGTLVATPNYDLHFTSNTLTIGATPLYVVAQHKTKVYGSADPLLDYVVTGFQNGDDASILTGGLSRGAGENVGGYGITLGSLSAGSNYVISYTSNQLNITPATLTITADAKSKTYGTIDPSLTYSISGLANGDTSAVVTGALNRTAGENVGAYTIHQGTVDAGDNYTISYVGDNLTINPATLTITADAKSKTYGASDPALTFTYTGLTNGDTSAVITGSLARTTGENVGTYAINQGSVGATSNYTINYVSDNLTINPATLTITADAKTKTYGTLDPSLTYTISGLANGDTSSVVTGSLTRNAGENVGTYAINQGSVAATSNYTINYVSDNLTINPATLTITADAQSKVYGTIDPSLTYSISGLANGDTASLITGTLNRNAGENVGTYAINQGSIAATSNYTINYVSDNLTITPATLTITADAQSKVYGTIDPSLTYSISGLANGDTSSIVTGSLARNAGENVGTYAINQGSVTATSNYTITYIGDNLTINPATLTIAADAQSKTYGTIDPSLTYTISGLANGDSSSIITGSLARNSGENVGTYAINQGSIAATSNYTITYIGDNLTINPATLTITADAKAKTYGTIDPSLTYTILGLANGDTSSVVTGSLVRNAGENVGTYAINQGSVAATSNYTLVYVGDNLTINPATLTITADAKTKTYGTIDPSLTYTISGLANGDTSSVISGSLTRNAGENVGNYAINLGSVTASNNYTISYVGDNLTINPAALTITADAQSKTYGTTDPTLTYTISGLANGDTSSIVTGSLARNVGENVGTYAINQGSLGATSNYTLTYVGENLTINPATLTITADAKAKTYGTIDPSLTYTISGLANGDASSVVTGSLTRNTGENVGTYAINQGSVAATSNYTINYVSDNLTINPATLTITADAKTKTYGSIDPSLTYTISGLANGDTSSIVTGSLNRNAGENVGTYAINQGTVNAGSNYTINYAASNLTIDPAMLTVLADGLSKTYGASDPTLSFNATGFVNGDTPGLLTGTLNRDAGENVGTYAIHLGSLSAGANYQITYVGNDLAITPAQLTVHVNDTTRAYGSSNPAFNATISGLTNGDSINDLPGLSITTSADSHSNVGAYSIGAAGISNPNYTVNYVDGTLNVTPAQLTVHVADASRLFGQENPTFGVSLEGLKDWDSTDVVSGLTVGTTATRRSPIGSYGIFASGAIASNYSITYVDGTLKVLPDSNTNGTTTVTDNERERLDTSRNTPAMTDLSLFGSAPSSYRALPEIPINIGEFRVIYRRDTQLSGYYGTTLRYIPRAWDFGNVLWSRSSFDLSDPITGPAEPVLDPTDRNVSDISGE